MGYQRVNNIHTTHVLHTVLHSNSLPYISRNSYMHVFKYSLIMSANKSWKRLKANVLHNKLLLFIFQSSPQHCFLPSLFLPSQSILFAILSFVSNLNTTRNVWNAPKDLKSLLFNSLRLFKVRSCIGPFFPWHWKSNIFFAEFACTQGPHRAAAYIDSGGSREP